MADIQPGFSSVLLRVPQQPRPEQLLTDSSAFARSVVAGLATTYIVSNFTSLQYAALAGLAASAYVYRDQQRPGGRRAGRIERATAAAAPLPPRAARY